MTKAPGSDTAAATFDVKPAYSGGFSQALMIALHKNHRADAYVVFLYDDYEAVRGRVQDNLDSLKFIANSDPQ